MTRTQYREHVIYRDTTRTYRGLVAPGALFSGAGAEGPKYQVHVVNRLGTKITTLLKVRVEEPTWELNAPGSARIHVPTFDNPQASQILLVDTEIQIWLEGFLLWWGVPWKRSGNANFVTYDCRGLFSYFDRRYVGGEIVPVYEDSFETATWTANNAAFGVGLTITQSLSTEQALIGTKSLKLVQTVANKDEWVQKQITGLSKESVYVLEAYAYLDQYGPAGESPNPVFIAAAAERRGILLWDFTNDVSTPGQVSRAVTQLDRGTVANPLEPERRHPHRQWTRHARSLKTGKNEDSPGAGVTMELRLYCPEGIIYWDALRVYKDESLTYEGVDQAQIAWNLVNHAVGLQTGTYALSITRSPNDVDHGVKRFREYFHSDTPQISRAVQEFTELDDGLDFDIEINSFSNAREWRSYFPRRGVERSNYVIEDGTNVTLLEYSQDGDQKANVVTVKGEDQKAATSRETAKNVNGVLLQSVVDGIPARMGAELKKRASSLLLATENSPEFITVEVPETAGHPYIGKVAPGDIFPVRLRRGPIQVLADYRLMKMTITPDIKKVRLELIKFIEGAARLGKPDLITELFKVHSEETRFPGSVEFGRGNPFYGSVDQITFSRSGAITGAVAAGARYIHPETVDILGVIVTLGTAPSTSSVIVDVLADGVSLFDPAGRPRVLAGNVAGAVAVTKRIAGNETVRPTVLQVSVIAGDAAAKDLTVTIAYGEPVTTIPKRQRPGEH